MDTRRAKRLGMMLIVLGLCIAAPTGADAQWQESKSAHSTVFFEAGYDSDAAFTRKWLDATEQLMKMKYGVTADRYYIAVYLLPAPTGDIDVTQSGQNQCCTSATTGLRTGTIRLLSRSAPVWNTGTLKSSLGLPKAGDDYHAKVLVSEYIPIGHYAAQDGRPAGAWHYNSAPSWFVQGLQEFDAIFHSTDSNRAETVQRLLRWARPNASKFSCCSPGLTTTDPYNGGASLMAFLASEFDEGIHARLLRSSASTFEAALASETQPFSPEQLFDRFHKSLDAIQLER
jgi:hypothetical protein